MRNILSTLSLSIPIHVTRKTADGTIGHWSVNAWLALVGLLLVTTNIILWGIVGVIQAVGVLA